VSNIIFRSPSVDVIVISVIGCAVTSDSYNSKRSRYTSCERLEQTLATISSIRTHVPGARIIFVEGGADDRELDRIRSAVDQYIFLGHSRLVRAAVDSQHKSLGEVALMIFALPALKRSASDLVLKITGRYRLNKNFTIGAWDPTKFNFKLSDRNVSTRLYGFPTRMRDRLSIALLWGCLKAARGKRMEQILHKSFFTHPRSYLSTLGIEGEAGPTGKFIDE
jgi:hypothetical protein